MTQKSSKILKECSLTGQGTTTRTIAASRPSTHFAAIWTTSRNRWMPSHLKCPKSSNWQLYNWSAYAGMIPTPPISPIVLFFPAIDATVPNFPKCGTRHYVIWGSSLRRPHHSQASRISDLCLLEPRKVPQHLRNLPRNRAEIVADPPDSSDRVPMRWHHW